MTSRRHQVSNRLCNFLQWIHRPLLAVLLGGAVLAGSGCTFARTITMKDAFPDSGMPGTTGPAVTVLTVQEHLEPGPHAADQTYVGKGLGGYMAIGPIFFPPIYIHFVEYHSDMPRIDIVRTAVLSQLKRHGIPSTYQTEGGDAGLKTLPRGSLGMSFYLRKIDVHPSGIFAAPLFVLSGFGWSDIVANVVLDCRFWQDGQANPVWEGSGEGTYNNAALERKRKESTDPSWNSRNVIGEAVSAAVDQCLTKSGLLEARTRPNERK